MAEAEVKACCLVSELLEEAGLDRRWQLERMGPEPAAPRPRRSARKVAVE